jgi:hypothetical protein
MGIIFHLTHLVSVLFGLQKWIEKPAAILVAAGRFILNQPSNRRLISSSMFFRFECRRKSPDNTAFAINQEFGEIPLDIFS